MEGKILYSLNIGYQGKTPKSQIDFGQTQSKHNAKPTVATLKVKLLNTKSEPFINNRKTK